jgi:Flp pilus assembly protein TadD
MLSKFIDEIPRARQLYLQGLLHENKGELEEALKKFNMALVQHLSDPALWLAKAKVLEGLGRMDMAKRAAGRACKLSTGDPAANLLYADILYKMKDLKGASEQVDIVLDLAPQDSDGLTLKGILVSTLEEDYRKALTLFDSAIESDEGNATAWTNRGIALRQIGDRDGSVYSFQKALMLDPDEKVSREMLSHMGEKKFILKSREKKKKKWSRSKFMTDSYRPRSASEVKTRKRQLEEEEEIEVDDDILDIEEMEDLDDQEVLEEVHEDMEVEEAAPEELEEIQEDDLVDEVAPPEDIFSDEEEEMEEWDDEDDEPEAVQVLVKKEKPPKKKKKPVKDGKKPPKSKSSSKKKKGSSRSLELVCPQCSEVFTISVKGRTEFECPGCGLQGEVE